MKVLNRARNRILGIVVTALALSAGAAAEGIADRVSVNDPYIRAVPPVVKTSAAFMQLQSSDEKERFLVGAATQIADAVELHMHTADDGVMRMRQIPHIHLPPNQTVSLEPGGLHVMLFDLNRELRPGDRVPMTLIFEDGSRKEIVAVVRPVGGMMH